MAVPGWGAANGAAHADTIPVAEAMKIVTSAAKETLRDLVMGT
ncbi:hypothetical protein QA641_31140 [Bradyrhizobium sp. CB1650]|nr:hypothetical protein [Bradyrhizobium sp. CB1650]WGD50060.1 hypothetical protein QA641_31140 [Bradyrhizobium sp. CB1650]